MNPPVSTAPPLQDGVLPAGPVQANSLLPAPVHLPLSTDITVPPPQTGMLPPPPVPHLSLMPPPAFLPNSSTTAQPVTNPLRYLNVSSLFEKLVSTGIISKSDTGAGYNVAKDEPHKVEKSSAKPVVDEKVKDEEKDKIKMEEKVDAIPAIELKPVALKKYVSFQTVN